MRCCNYITKSQILNPVEVFTPLDLENIYAWYHSSQDLTVGTGPDSGKWIRILDQAGTGIALENPTYDGAATASPEVGGKLVLDFSTADYYTTDGAAGPAGWTTGTTVTILTVARLAYNATNSRLFGYGKTDAGVSIYPSVYRRSLSATSSTLNKMQAGTADLGLNYPTGFPTDTDHINYYADGAVCCRLDPGESTPFHLFEFMWSPTDIEFRRDNALQKSASGSYTVKNFDGTQMRMSTNAPLLFWTDIILLDGTISAAERVSLAAWVTSTYGLDLTD